MFSLCFHKNMSKKLRSSYVKISFKKLKYISTVINGHFWKKLQFSFWQCKVGALRFSAEVWRQSEQNQALSNFSNFYKFERNSVIMDMSSLKESSTYAQCPIARKLILRYGPKPGITLKFKHFCEFLSHIHSKRLNPPTAAKFFFEFFREIWIW